MISVLRTTPSRRRYTAPSRKSVDKKEKTVDVGHTLSLKVNGKKITSRLVDTFVLENHVGIISLFSPLGSTLYGKRKNDEFEIYFSQNKIIHCKIMGIQ